MAHTLRKFLDYKIQDKNEGCVQLKHPTKEGQVCKFDNDVHVLPMKNGKSEKI